MRGASGEEGHSKAIFFLSLALISHSLSPEHFLSCFPFHLNLELDHTGMRNMNGNAHGMQFP